MSEEAPKPKEQIPEFPPRGLPSELQEAAEDPLPTREDALLALKLAHRAIRKAHSAYGDREFQRANIDLAAACTNFAATVIAAMKGPGIYPCEGPPFCTCPPTKGGT